MSASVNPDSRFRQAIVAYDAGAWTDFVHFVHPDALDAFQERRVGTAKLWAAPGQRGEPLFDEATALTGFRGVPTLADLIRLSAADVLACWLAGSVTSVGLVKRALVGVIHGGGPVAYVVYRSVTADSGGESKLHVIELRNREAEWFLMLNDDLAADNVQFRAFPR